VRPSWLKFGENKALELDGYNAELKIAFEYQGPQHYKRVPHFQKTDEEFNKQLEYDKLKADKCKERGITLYIIPYLFLNELPSYISKLVGKTCGNFKFNPGSPVGLNITKCLTGASISKKTFFNMYYKEQTNPVYSLDDTMDKYIRDFYYGGRTEIFQIGKVKADKLYYYDFTSLYPSIHRSQLASI
jgi:hypothetical protein